MLALMLNCGANLTGDAWTTEMRVDDCCGSDSRDAVCTLSLFDNAVHRVFVFSVATFAAPLLRFI
jgi:hypothetical protein